MNSKPIQITSTRKPVRDWTPEYVNEMLFPDGYALVDNRGSYMKVKSLLQEITYFRECYPYDEYDTGAESLLNAYLGKFKCSRV